MALVLKTTNLLPSTTTQEHRYKTGTYGKSDFIFTHQTGHSNFLGDYLLPECLFFYIQSIPYLLFGFAENSGMYPDSGQAQTDWK